jgi:hypothetical protein
MIKMFISSPMSSLTTQTYDKFRKGILPVIDYLKEKINDINIYYSGLLIKNESEFQGSVISFRNDIYSLENSNIFLLIYPEKTPTSALIELGYALKMKIPVIIMVPEKRILPYMVQEMDKALTDVFIFEYKEASLIQEFKKNPDLLKTIKAAV